MRKIMFVFGTRPEAIKMWPIIRCAQQTSGLHTVVCVTSQQLNLQDQALKCLELEADYNLAVMLPNQTLDHIVASVLAKLGPVLDAEHPDLVLVQGDTTTAFSAALAAFHRQIPVAHIEAGLRTHQRLSPFPEEMNRVLLSRLADWHFAATEKNAENLRAEGVRAEQILVVGNPVVDAVNLVFNNQTLQQKFNNWLSETLTFDLQEPFIVATLHRRENFGEPLRRIWQAITTWMSQNPNWHCVLPIHPNPKVKTLIEADKDRFPNLHIIEPVDYFNFLFLLKRARFVVSDSGGIQEEAPTLNVPVVLVRENTERPEALGTGWVKMVGTQTQAVFDQMNEFQKNGAAAINGINPFGNGDASAQIVANIIRLLA